MSLIPSGAANFPVIFLEARMLGQPTAQIISQLGISVDAPDCSVAVFTRASGVLLVAGVGSYCAYRICTRFLGQRFVWMLLDSARCDQLASADIRLLHPTPLHTVDDDDEGDRNSESEWLSRVDGSRPASEMSIGRLQRVRRSVRAKGLLGLSQQRTPRSGVVRREGSQTSSVVPRLRSRTASPTGSECSASLNILWEGHQMWDDEFAESRQPSMLTRVGPLAISNNQTPIHTRFEPAPSMGDMCSVFDDILSITTREDHMERGIHCGGEAFMEENDDVPLCEEREEDESAEDLMRLKCMTDSKYMYQSVIVGSEVGGSEIGSVYSSRSGASNLHSLRRKLNRTVKPNGLWDLTHETPSTSTGLGAPNPMTDSGLSSGIRSEPGKSGGTGRQSMFDSALGLEVFASDDYSMGDMLKSKDGTSKQSFLGRMSRITDETSERMSVMSGAISVTSLEWFDDDGLKPTLLHLDDVPSDLLDNIRVPINGLDFDFDSLRQASSESGSRMSKRSSNFNQNSSPANSAPRPPTDSRDLLVFACEKFPLNSKEFKNIESIYLRKRLKRVGAPCSEPDEFLSKCLTSILYNDGSPIGGMTKVQLGKTLRRNFKKFPEFFDLLSGLGTKKECKTTESYQNLLDALHEACEVRCFPTDATHVTAYKIFLLLKVMDVFERSCPKDLKRLMEIASIIYSGKLSQRLLQLVAWATNVTFLIYNINSTDIELESEIGNGPKKTNFMFDGINYYPLFSGGPEYEYKY